jgi:hypothetical protein
MLRRIVKPTEEDVAAEWKNCTMRSLTLCNSFKYYQSNQGKEDEMGGAYSPHGYIKNEHKTSVGTPGRKRSLGRPRRIW